MAQPLLRWSLAILVLLGAGVPMLTAIDQAAAQEASVFVDAINVTPQTPIAGESFIVTATVKNSASSQTEADLTEVGIRRDGQLTFNDDLGTLGPGDSTAVPIEQTIDEVGRHKLTIIVHAKDANNRPIYLQFPVYVEVRDQPAPVSLAITAAAPTVDEDTAVNVTLANGGDSPVTDIELTLDGDGTIRNPRRVSASLGANSDREYGFTVRFPEAGQANLTATVSYLRENGVSRTRTASTTLQVDPPSGTEGHIRLTGVTTSGAAGSLTIQGEAANVGTTDAQGVLLSIESADGVTPVQPNREYFVGTVEGSEFGTFELTARVDPSVESIPIRAEWTVDDERRSEVYQVPIDDLRRAGPTPAQPPRNGPSSSGPLSLIGGLPGLAVIVVILLVLGGGSLLWTRG